MGATLLLGAACQEKKAIPDPPAVRIQAISPANAEKYQNLKSMRDWRNPYLILHQDHIGILNINDNVERILKPEELAQALADLPGSSWPYGRVVAIQSQSDSNSEEEKIEFRRNRGLVVGTLGELQILIRWVPSS